jgi:hypothetical protein
MQSRYGVIAKAFICDDPSHHTLLLCPPSFHDELLMAMGDTEAEAEIAYKKQDERVYCGQAT